MSRAYDVVAEDLLELEARAGAELETLADMRVLVTGGAGFLLSYLVDALARRLERPGARGHLVVVDDFTTSTRHRLAHLAQTPHVELRESDASTLVVDEPFDLIIHGASIASPVHYRRMPIRTMEVNALGTWSILRSIVDRKDTLFVLLSTSEVYGDPDPARVPIPETYEGRVSIHGPRACYDESKRFAETLASIYHREHGTRTRIVRPFNVYGPGMHEGDGRVVPSLLGPALRGEDVVLHSDGSPRRAFCYVTDFIAALLRVIVHGHDGEPYNVGDDREEISMRTLAERIVVAAGSTSAIRVQASDDAHYLTDNPQRRCPDLTKLRGLGGDPPTVSMDARLVRCARWMSAVAAESASEGRAR